MADETPKAPDPTQLPTEPAAADTGDVDAFVAGMMDTDPAPAAPSQGEPALKEPKPTSDEPEKQAAPAEPEKDSKWKTAIAAERAKQEARRRDKDMVRLDDLRARAAQNPAAFAEQFGLTVDGLLSALVPPKPGESDAEHVDDPDRRVLLDRIAKLEEREKAREEQAREAELRRQQDGELDVIRGQLGDREVAKLLADEAVPLAHQVAVAMIEANGITPTRELLRQVYPAALDAVEDHLTDRERERVQKAMGTAKLQALLGKPTVSGDNGSRLHPTIGSNTAATAAPRELSESEEMDAIFRKHWEQGS